MHQLEPERFACSCEEVAVAGGVHDDLGQERLAARLALGDHAPDRAVGDDRPGDPGVQPQPHARLHEQLVRDETELLRIVSDRVPDGVWLSAPDEPVPPVVLDELRIRVAPFLVPEDGARLLSP